MYNFDKLDNEVIILISDNSILKKDEEEVNISTILTDKRLILLDYPGKTNNYEEALRTSRGSEYVIKKEPILIINITDIKEIIRDNKFDKYILNSSNFFYLEDENIKSKLKELI